MKSLKLVAVDELHYYHDMLGRYGPIELYHMVPYRHYTAMWLW